MMAGDAAAEKAKATELEKKMAEEPLISTTYKSTKLAGKSNLNRKYPFIQRPRIVWSPHPPPPPSKIRRHPHALTLRISSHRNRLDETV
jgi:hypothetical protein